jgi:4-amino-4-deoxy-L-arabinose transferase-like glycosyltransferase
MRTFYSDAKHLIQDLICIEPNRRFIIALALVTFAGTLVRIAFLNQPFKYDEAYTLIVFARKPVLTILSDYHLPNNHILHSILVHFSSRLFGFEPWAVRLPAFLAGILLTPAVYFAGRMLYGKFTALFACTLAAFSWTLIDYSSNARGYSIVCLLFVLILGLAVYIKDNRNTAGWVLIILFAAAGFFTIPIMLYPFGIVLTWLFLSYLMKDVAEEYRKNFPLYLLVCGAASGILALGAYYFVIRNLGIEAISGNRYVASPGWGAFLESIPVRIVNTWSEWGFGVPSAWMGLLLLGLLLSIVFHRAYPRNAVHYFAAVLVFLVPVLLVQQVAPLPKVWLFLISLFFILSSAGWVFAIKLLTSRIGFLGETIPDKFFLLYTILVGSLLFWNLWQTPKISHIAGFSSKGEIEKTVLQIREIIEPEDGVVSGIPVNFPLRYYFLRYDLPLDQFYRRPRNDQFDRLFIVTDASQNQDLEGMLEYWQLDESTGDKAKLVFRSGSVSVHLIER